MLAGALLALRYVFKFPKRSWPRQDLNGGQDSEEGPKIIISAAGKVRSTEKATTGALRGHRKT
jgi:hypothetical protein